MPGAGGVLPVKLKLLLNRGEVAFVFVAQLFHVPLISGLQLLEPAGKVIVSCLQLRIPLPRDRLKQSGVSLIGLLQSGRFCGFALGHDPVEFFLGLVQSRVPLIDETAKPRVELLLLFLQLAGTRLFPVVMNRP